MKIILCLTFEKRFTTRETLFIFITPLWRRKRGGVEIVWFGCGCQRRLNNGYLLFRVNKDICPYHVTRSPSYDSEVNWSRETDGDT